MCPQMTGKNRMRVRSDPQQYRIYSFHIPCHCMDIELFFIIILDNQVHGKLKLVTERRSSSAGRTRARKTLAAQEGWPPNLLLSQHLPRRTEETVVIYAGITTDRDLWGENLLVFQLKLCCDAFRSSFQTREALERAAQRREPVTMGISCYSV